MVKNYVLLWSIYLVGQEHVKMILMKFDRFQESVTNMNGKSEFHFLGRILSKNISRNAYNPKCQIKNCTHSGKIWILNKHFCFQQFVLNFKKITEFFCFTNWKSQVCALLEVIRIYGSHTPLEKPCNHETKRRIFIQMLSYLQSFYKLQSWRTF